MKLFIVGLILATSAVAHAEVYTETGGVWHTRCSTSDWGSDAYESLKDDARNDACEQAKQTCLDQHSAKHPSAVFHCEIETSNLVYGYQNVTSLKDGTYCTYTNQGMDTAQYTCTVEVIPGAE